ncbi:MAG: Hpt domain-containing protein [Roseibium sp.]|nr:Hpt domain-containing protein [Roseibium sp.]
MTHASAIRAVPNSAPRPPVDLVRLAANTMGNRDLELQVLQLFKTQSAAMLARLADTTDIEARAEIIHTLKGSARAVGAEHVGKACEAMEAEIGAGRDAPHTALSEAVIEANRYISELLSG